MFNVITEKLVDISVRFDDLFPTVFLDGGRILLAG
jgi:hypothetical protein